MSDGAVVALEEVLAADLPVGRDLELGSETELERIDVNDLCELGRYVAERLVERRPVSAQVYEDQRAPGSDGDLLQPEIFAVEPGLAIRARGSAQPPVEAVGPRVVGTLERLPRPRAGGNDMSPVPADVEERPQLAVPRACNNYRDLARRRREESARVSDLSQVARVLPGAGEDSLALAAKNVRIGIPGPGQRPLHA